MIKRIVKMKFKKEYINDFKNIFSTNQTKILASKGCQHVELLQDKNDPQVFFTFSLWQSEADLNQYRNSDLFKQVWQNTKAKFEARAEAWSLNQVQ